MKRVAKTLLDDFITVGELYDYFESLSETDEEYDELNEFFEDDEYDESVILVKCEEFKNYAVNHGIYDDSEVPENFRNHIDKDSYLDDLLHDYTLIDLCGYNFYVCEN